MLVRNTLLLSLFFMITHVFSDGGPKGGAPEADGLERADTVPYNHPVPAPVVPDGGVLPRGGTVGGPALRRVNGVLPIPVPPVIVP